MSKSKPGPPCIVCNGPTTTRSRLGRCRRCAYEARRRPIPTCSDCGVPITRSSRGRCRPCSAEVLNSDKAFHARRIEGIRRKFEDPEHRAKMAAVARRVGQKAAVDPDHRAWLIEHGRRQVKRLWTPEARARFLAGRPAAGRKISETRMGWCPPEYRDEYRRLCRSKRLNAADARAIIEQKIANQDALGDVDSALDYLRRFAPVAKLENGFRYGNAILTPAEVVSRARVRGWQPERLVA